ncbi:MAG: TrkA family potassium uptake protein [Pygmaiobacter massiliensis]|nr:TrkA family potassium uptake protein [Pygmaiobacter massiliensis]
MNRKKAAPSFGVIGLGRFGMALAKSLAQAEKEVLVLDCNESKVREMRQYTEHAYVVRELSKQALEDAGVQNCDTVIVCIGEKIDTSILTTLNVVSLGVPTVISKAISAEQGQILQKIGAEVIYPEHDMALRLAKRLLAHSLMDYISLSNDIEISEVPINHMLVGTSVKDADLRRTYGINIIAIENEESTTIEILPDYIFQKQDIIVVVGKSENLKKFANAALV